MDSKRLDKTTDEVEKIKFFQQGDFPKTQHGIFNPSVVQFGNYLKFIFRCEPSQATWSGYFMTDKGVPQISTGELTQDGLQVNPPKPVYSGMPLSCRPEDWRLFLFREKIYTNFTNYFYLDKKWPQKTVHCRTAIGELTEDRIIFLQEMSCSGVQVKMNKEEKNWVFFEDNDKLYAIYSIEPFVTFLVDENWQINKMQSREIRFNRLGYRYLSCSTNPILVNFPKLGECFFMFCHQFLTPKGKGSRNRTYYQHGLVFRKSDHKPIAWTPMPMTGGGVAIGGRHDGVVYFSGAFQDEANIYATSGEGDSNCAIYRFPISLIEKNLRKI